MWNQLHAVCHDRGNRSLIFVRVESPLMRVIVRIALLPVIAGISYELIKWAGSSENPVVCILK